MPYVFVDELAEGQEEAEVYSPDDYNAVMMERDTAIGQIEDFRSQVAELTGERDSLMGQLDDAKRKFADSFLTSAARIKREQDREMRSEERPATFDSLFKERNPTNAN